MTIRWWHLLIVAVIGGLLGWWLSPARGFDQSMNRTPTGVHSVNNLNERSSQ